MVLGPLDKRTLRTRCQACARRRIKCEGSQPCNYCVKKKIPCISQAEKKQSGLIIINNASPNENLAKNAKEAASSLPMRISMHASDRFAAHFFSSYMIRNELAGECLNLDTLVSPFQKSTCLQNVIIAIGALDLSKSLPDAERRPAKVTALTSYRAAIRQFQSEINTGKIQQDESAPWTTFFLGLFELMYDVTGDGWMKHILYGTAKILQLRGPEAHLTGPGRSFFVAVRVYEISRAIFYDGISFLNEPRWLEVNTKIWEGQLMRTWHPKEGLFDLMLASSSLANKVWELLCDETSPPTEPKISILKDFAIQGITIRESIEEWHDCFQNLFWEASGTGHDPWMLLAEIYYHGISIYLSGIFDYRTQFDTILSPKLSYKTIESHKLDIIAKTELALRVTNLAGILFFFPLRVAGARAKNVEERARILKMLGDISGRSFIVADTFISDLQNLWLGG